MPQRHEYRMSPAHVERIHPLDLLLVDYRHKESGGAKHQGPVEPRWRYAGDGKRMLVHADDAAHHAPIVGKMGVPIIVGEHDVWRAVGTMLVGAVKETAKIRLKPQYVEVVPAHDTDPGMGWIVARVQPYLIDAKACQTIETAVLVAQVEIVGIRLPHVMFVSVLDSVKAFRLRHGHRAKDQPVQYSKNHGVCADR